MPLFFLVALRDSIPAIEGALSKVPPEDLYTIENGKWIVSSAATTAKNLAESLGLSESTTTFVVVPVRGYFGRAQPDLWEWLAEKTAARVAKDA
jgi:hypothetical protein